MLAEIVSTDVVSYSRLTGFGEACNLAVLITNRAKRIDGRIETHGGRIIKKMSDGLLLK